MAASQIRDSRLDELEKMGLARTHLRVAEEIGVDAFLAMWRIYDADPAFRTDKGDLEVRMRSFRSYTRFQRNRYIESLLAAGLRPVEVQVKLREHLCEEVTAYHISRIGRKSRIKA